MADIKTTEEIGLELQKRRPSNLSDTESWVVTVPAEDNNFKSAVKRLTLEEVDHLLQIGIITQDSKLKAIRRRRVDLAGPDVPEVETSPERTLVEPESWDNEGFRERVAKILSEAEYPIVNIEDIIIPEVGLGKFQYRRFRENDGLYDSILRMGIFEEITLQGTEDLKYHIIDGNSRFRHWLRAREEDSSLPTPVFRVLDISDADAAQVAVEINRFGQNLDEEDLQALVIRLVEEAGIRQKDIAGQLGISESYVSNIVAAFQKVPSEARALIEQRKWTVRHGRHLARLHDHSKIQKRITKQAMKTGYSSSEMNEKVKRELLKLEFETKSKKVIDDLAKTVTRSEGQALGEVTVDQADSIHYDLVEKFGTKVYKPSGYKMVLSDGDVEANATITQTKKLLKEKGYTIIPTPAITETDEDGKTVEKAVPSMPSKDDLMDGPSENFTCSYCGGPTHPAVSESLGFETVEKYRGYNQGRGMDHSHCDLKDDIVELGDEIAEMERRLAESHKELKKETLSKLMKRKDKTLKQINNEGHAIFKEELERRKLAWRDEHLPEPEEIVKKGSKVGDVIKKKKPVVDHEEDDSLELLKQVRTLQPDLVKDCFFIAYEKNLQKAVGYTSQAEVKKTLSSSMGTVSRNFLKISAAIDKLRGEAV